MSTLIDRCFLVATLSVLVPPAGALGSSARGIHVVQVLDAKEGQTIADVGCGSGWLAEVVAKAVGSSGRVYAVELRESSLRKVRARKIPNIVTIQSVPHDVSLPERQLDVIFLHDVASHVAKHVRRSFYSSITKALKPEGRLVIFGPHGDAKALLDEIRSFGFRDEEDLSDLSTRKLDAKLRHGVRFKRRRIFGPY